MKWKTLILFAWTLAGSALPVRCQIDTLEIRRPAQGVTYVSLVDSTKPWRIHLLKVELNQTPSLHLRTHRAAPNNDPCIPDRETLPAMWEYLESDSLQPVAAINGDFFDLETGEPINLQVSNQKPVFVPKNLPGRSQFGVTTAGTPFIGIVGFSATVSVNGHHASLDGFNRIPEANSLILFSTSSDLLPVTDDSLHPLSLKVLKSGPANGEYHYTLEDVTRAGPPLLIASGHMKDSLAALEKSADQDTVYVTYRYQKAPAEAPIAELIGGAVQLLKNGKNVVDLHTKLESVNPSFATDRHPRTAVGFSPEGRFWMVVVDGRQKSSAGMSLHELAGFLESRGVTDALNLDGGGSSTMMVGGKIVNAPSDSTGPRPVSNGLFLIKK